MTRHIKPSRDTIHVMIIVCNQCKESSTQSDIMYSLRASHRQVKRVIERALHYKLLVKDVGERYTTSAKGREFLRMFSEIVILA